MVGEKTYVPVLRQIKRGQREVNKLLNNFKQFPWEIVCNCMQWEIVCPCGKLYAVGQTISDKQFPWEIVCIVGNCMTLRELYAVGCLGLGAVLTWLYRTS